jgi:hypothetical protein
MPQAGEADEKMPVSPGTRTDSESTLMTTTPSHVGSPLLVLVPSLVAVPSLAVASSLTPQSKSPLLLSDSQPLTDERARRANRMRITIPMPAPSLRRVHP